MKRFGWLRATWVALLATFAALAAPGASAAPLSAAELDSFIKQALRTYAVPGAAVAVVQDDRVVLLKGYGMRTLGNDAPVDENTVFQLASNTKTFTAATLASLVGEGRLSWDQEVIDVLPQFVLHDPYATRHATLRDLLAHRTGLPEFRGDLLGELGYDRAEVLRRIRAIPPQASFREEALYSNLGFFAAGEVAARAAGASWNDAVESRILRPLGMTRSAASVLTAPKDDNRAGTLGLVDGKMAVLLPSHQIVMGSAGSMVSTAADLSRYMRMLLNKGELEGKRILTAEAVEELFEPSMVAKRSFTETPPISAGTGFGYTMGWGYFYLDGAQVLEKGGALDGVRTVVVLVPDRKLGIAVLANRNLTLLPEAIRAFALQRALGTEVPNVEQVLLETQKKIDALFDAEPVPASPGQPSIPLAAFAGTYESDIYGRFEVTAHRDRLAIAAGPKKYAGTLRHFSHDTFTLTWPLIDYGAQPATFTIGPDGRPLGFTTMSFGDFKRVDPAR